MTIKEEPFSTPAPPAGLFSHESKAKVKKMHINRVNLVLLVISFALFLCDGYFCKTMF
jgi:hypothetical protein